eukprot:1036330-Karenia_brevis.AAC.1
MLPGVDVESDHILGVATLRQRPCRTRPAATTVDTALERAPERIEARALKEYHTQQAYTDAALDGLCKPGVLPKDIDGILREAGQSCLGLQDKQRRPEWQTINRTTLMKLSQNRRLAYERFRARPGVSTKKSFRAACKRNRAAVARMINEWWAEQAEDIQKSANKHDISAVFAGVRQLSRELGSLPRAVDPHKAGGIKAHMIEMANHFEAVLNIERPVSWEVVHATLAMVHPTVGVDWSPPDERK